MAATSFGATLWAIGCVMAATIARLSTVGPGGLDHELEASAVPQADDAEMSDVAGGEAANAELLGQRDHRGVDQAEAQPRVVLVDLHRPMELRRRRWRIREGAARQVA